MTRRVALLLAALLALGMGACARELQAAFPWCSTRTPQPVSELCGGPNKNCACSPTAFKNGCDPYSYKCTATKCNGQPCASPNKCINNQCIANLPLSFRLVWHTNSDVDLASEDPNGCTTDYDGNCNGAGSTKSVLYYDCQEDDDSCPLPNKQEFLGVSSPVAGTYTITVTYYETNGEGTTTFELYVTKGGVTTMLTGSLAEEDDTVEFSISYP